MKTIIESKPVWQSDINAINIILESLEQIQDLDTRNELLRIAGKLIVDAANSLKEESK